MLVLLMLLMFGLMLVFVSSNQSNPNAFKCKQTIEYHLFKMFFLLKFNWPESYFWNLNIQYNNKVKSNKYSLNIKLIFKILFNFKFLFKSFMTESFYFNIKKISEFHNNFYLKTQLPKLMSSVLQCVTVNTIEKLIRSYNWLCMYKLPMTTSRLNQHIFIVILLMSF